MYDYSLFFLIRSLVLLFASIIFCTTKNTHRVGGPSILAAHGFDGFGGNRRRFRCTGANEAETSTIETMRIGKKNRGGDGRKEVNTTAWMKTIPNMINEKYGY